MIEAARDAVSDGSTSGKQAGVDLLARLSGAACNKGHLLNTPGVTEVMVNAILKEETTEIKDTSLRILGNLFLKRAVCESD